MDVLEVFWIIFIRCYWNFDPETFMESENV